MCCLAATATTVGACLVLSVFHSKRWLLLGAAAGVAGYAISRRTRVP
jgi:hypothetical protein